MEKQCNNKKIKRQKGRQMEKYKNKKIEWKTKGRIQKKNT